MTAAAELYGVLHGLGISLRLVEGHVKVRAPKGVLTPALRQAMRDQKVGLMALMQPQASAEARIEAFEERAALMEYDGRLCRAEAERLAWDCVADNEQRQSEARVATTRLFSRKEPPMDPTIDVSAPEPATPLPAPVSLAEDQKAVLSRRHVLRPGRGIAAPFWLHYGVVLGGKAGRCALDTGVTTWRLTRVEPAYPELTALLAQTFPSDEALCAAVDTQLGAERVAHLRAAHAAQREAEAVMMEAARQAAAARSFTGVKFDAVLPWKALAAALQRDIADALAAGRLPLDRYRVTARRVSYGAPEIVIWTWHRGATTRAMLDQLAQAYNQCEGGAGFDTTDRVHFRLRCEETELTKGKTASAELRRGLRTKDLSDEDRSVLYTQACQEHERLVAEARLRETGGCLCWETGDCAPGEARKEG